MCLTRVNGWLAGGLAGMVALRLLLWPMAKPACAQCVNRPVHCDYVNGIAAVYLNDNIAFPQALDNTTGTLTGRSAEFKVYGLLTDSGYVDYTASASRAERLLHVKVRAAPGSHDVSGRVEYSNHENLSRILYRPRRSYRQDRTALITFEFSCCPHNEAPIFRTTFTLTIPGEQPTGAPAAQN